MILPEPTYTLPDRKKKPHAKKQPTGHIPRPRNAFILFRCDFVRQKKIPANVEKDHRNISRIVGQIWRQMSEKQKEPWVLMAEGEKLAHSKLYPSYKFPAGVSNKKSKRDDIPYETQEPEDHHYFWDDLPNLCRSSSCAVGTPYVPQANLECCNSYGAPLETCNDMGRRSSRVTFYQPTSSLSPEAFTHINNQHFAEFTQEDYSKAAANQFYGPRINIHPYLTPGPNDPPEWDVVAPTQPYTWTDWSAFQFDQSSVKSAAFETDTNRPFFKDPLLSTLPPLPYWYDAFPLVDYASQPSFTALETEAPSTYSTLERYNLPDAPLAYVYVQNMAKHSNAFHNPPSWNGGYHDSSGEQYQIPSQSFSGLPADFRGNE